jgi:ABC-type uncharacterized transport system ATPase subunit
VTPTAAVRFDRVTKRFPGVVALEDVTFEIAAGACHALCGENGAGKSTLGKILSGIHEADSGQILLDGRPVRFSSPTDALAAGVGMVHQELSFCENLTVAENLCLGSLPNAAGFISLRDGDAGPDRSNDRRQPCGRRAHDRPAADAADRGRDRTRRADHHLRRADEQPLSARS